MNIILSKCLHSNIFCLCENVNEDFVTLLFYNWPNGIPLELKINLETAEAAVDGESMPWSFGGWNFAAHPLAYFFKKLYIKTLVHCRGREIPRTEFQNFFTEFGAALKSFNRRANSKFCQKRKSFASKYLPHLRPQIYVLLNTPLFQRNLSLITNYPGITLLYLQIGERVFSEIESKGLDRGLDGIFSFAYQNSLIVSPILNFPLISPNFDFFESDERVKIKKHRLLVKKAKAWVLPRYLVTAPPIEIIPELIPQKKFLNAQWFKAVYAYQFAIYRDRTAPEKLQRNFVKFLNLHPGLAARSRRNVGRVYFFCKTHNLYPDFKTDLSKLLVVSRAWYKSRRTNPNIDHNFGAELDDAALKLTILPVLSEPQKFGDLSIVPINNAYHLKKEGEELNHCIFSYLKSGIEGRKLFYSVLNGNHRFTLMVDRNDMEFEFRGLDNVVPNEEYTEMVSEWLKMQPFYRDESKLCRT